MVKLYKGSDKTRATNLFQGNYYYPSHSSLNKGFHFGKSVGTFVYTLFLCLNSTSVLDFGFWI